MYIDSYDCSRCHLEVVSPPDFQAVHICPHCSWDKNSVELNAEKSNMKRAVIATTFVFALFIVGIVQAGNWGQFFFKAIPLQTKYWLGAASETDYQKLAKIRLQLNDANGLEVMLQNKVQLNPTLESLKELGEVQFQRRNYESAAVTLRQYLSKGGKDLYARFNYARALGALGQVDQAVEQFERILAIKPNAIQITVTNAYVDMLVKNHRNSQAIAVIKKIQSNGSNAASFMQAEMRQIASTK